MGLYWIIFRSVGLPTRWPEVGTSELSADDKEKLPFYADLSPVPQSGFSLGVCRKEISVPVGSRIPIRAGITIPELILSVNSLDADGYKAGSGGREPVQVEFRFHWAW